MRYCAIPDRSTDGITADGSLKIKPSPTHSSPVLPISWNHYHSNHHILRSSTSTSGDPSHGGDGELFEGHEVVGVKLLSHDATAGVRLHILNGTSLLSLNPPANLPLVLAVVLSKLPLQIALFSSHNSALDDNHERHK